MFKIVLWRRGPVKASFSSGKCGGMLMGYKKQFHAANQHVSYCLVEVIRRVGACSVDASIGLWFGIIVRYGVRIGELSSAKGESKECVETRDVHLLNERLGVKS